MFQRLKGFNLDSFLDSKIAEEQAKQAQHGRSSPSRRTPSSADARRRTDSPGSGRPRTRQTAPEVGNAATTKGPDPEEFVIGDDTSDVSRVATPMPVREGVDGPIFDKAAVNSESKSEKEDGASTNGEGKAVEDATLATEELPEEVRRKLAKLEHLTVKYQDLLRNYRTAHARVSTIEPFEATLREHTPLMSIVDPGALVEFLNQRSLQSEMVLQELKRINEENKAVAKERDELRAKLDEAESSAKEAFDEAAGLTKERAENDISKGSTYAAQSKRDESKTSGAPAVLETGSADDETFFSYETELPRLEADNKKLEAELEDQRASMDRLSAVNETLRNDLANAQRELSEKQETIDASQHVMTAKENESAGKTERVAEANAARAKAVKQQEETAAVLATTEASLSDLESRWKDLSESTAAETAKLKERAKQAEEDLVKLRQEREASPSNPTMVQREDRLKEVHNNVLDALRKQVKDADEGRRIAEGHAIELEFEMKRLESETNASGALIAQLRGHEAESERLRTQLSAIEGERNEAQRLTESKRDHEVALASLRSQLERAERARNNAYEMILECAKVSAASNRETKADEADPAPNEPIARSRRGSDATEHAEVAPQSAGNDKKPANGDAPTGEAKKKNKKKKSKAKKQGAQESLPTFAPLGTDKELPVSDVVSNLPTVSDLIDDPERTKGILLHRRDDKVFIDFIEKALHDLKIVRQKDDDDQSSQARHNEQAGEQMIRDSKGLIGEKDDDISALHRRIGEQEIQIQKLNENLKDQETLQEEIETMRESLIELGSEATDAKHDLKQEKEKSVRQQEEFEVMELERENLQKSLKDAEAQRDGMEEKLQKLQAELQNRDGSHSLQLEQAKQSAEERFQAISKELYALQSAKEACDAQIEGLKRQHTANGVEVDARTKTLQGRLDDLTTRHGEVEKDLAAANALAQTRYRDLADTKEQYGKVQSELKRLREESEELKKLKAEVEQKHVGLKRLEAKERDLRSEIAEYKSQVSIKDREIVELREQAKTSVERTSALEDTYERARRDLEESKKMRDEATETKEKLQLELKKAQEDLEKSKSKVEDLRKQVNKLRDETSRQQEEMQLKAAQHASAQSLMSSMQDQTRELATQMKEVKERNESLEEELADAHRLLSERARESETMRRLLADVEGRADAKVKEMRERMDLAVEERDRAEDEASSIGRRRAREIEELKARLRDAERDAARASEARGEAERRVQDGREKREKLESRAAKVEEELAETRAAMGQLRDALDEVESRSRDLEKEKADVNRTLEEREARLEKLQKSSKSMAEELRSLQAANKARYGSAAPSSRSSIDSSRVTSPVQRGGSNGTPTPGGANKLEIDAGYLKNVLLQFLEQKEKKYQMQLVPVLGNLLRFDRQDEQKWIAAISAR